jgi:peptidyl-prolyl cis-trans isomerase D
MLSFFRRLSKSKIGTGIMGILLLASLVGFGLINTSNFGSGNLGLGLGSSDLAKAGDEVVTDHDMSEAMQHRLQQVREQNPNADYSAIAGDFEPLLDSLIDDKTLMAFADKFGFRLSKALIDAEIVQIPQTHGLNGQFDEARYQAFLAQQHLTDDQVREIIRGTLLQRLLLTPIATNARVPVAVALPYASMLLEQRTGEVAGVPMGAFRAGLNPTDADIQQFYAANKARYIVPEQRVLRIARIGTDQVANVTASDQDIAAYYNAHQDVYGAKELRVLSQAVVPDRKAADAIAARAKSGGSFAAAAAPAGLSAQDVTLGPQTPEQFAGVAGNAVAAAVFAAKPGTIVGPVQSPLGWHVIKVESVKSQGGKTLAEAKGEIAAKLTADKRKDALTDLVQKVEDMLDSGSNFTETAAKANLAVTTTPLITANGTSRTDVNYKFPPELAPALKSGFELAPNDEPVVETLPNDQGYALVGPAQIIPAAPAPLASIRQQVANDWINTRAMDRAKAVAAAIEAKVEHGVSLADALKQANAPLPPVHPLAARRIEIAAAQGAVPPALRMLFTLAQGKSRIVPDPQGRGYFVVKLNSITPGNAMLQPALIAKMQSELQEAAAEDYAREFVAAARREMKVQRNESAIAATKARITRGGG